MNHRATPHRRVLVVVAAIWACVITLARPLTADDVALANRERALEEQFQKHIRPLVQQHCLRCHGAEKMESGIRLDQLNGGPDDRQLQLWRAIAKLLENRAMPPDEEPQPSDQQRKQWLTWIDSAMQLARERPQPWNGSVRRLTIAQYRNTLRDLLGVEDDFTDLLPADTVSKDGFLNHEQSMLLSPLLLEAYFNIAEKALDACLVDESQRPTIQNFRMDFGAHINPAPLPEQLILGANSLLLQNHEFLVTELTPDKPFAFEPFRMQTKLRFNEGYQGNATVRGWREYDSIYHSVFACMRGNGGYPKGLAYEVIPDGLLLRPAIPSAELFQVESTYGPQANFKVSLRELPRQGRFRVTVRAQKYDDGLLLEGDSPAIEPTDRSVSVELATNAGAPVAQLTEAGVYQVDVRLLTPKPIASDASRLDDQLAGHWPLDRAPIDSEANTEPNNPTVTEGVQWRESPFAGAAEFDGAKGEIIVPRTPAMKVAQGDFTVAAWIHPRELRQAGIVTLGGYGYTHGWVFDMPNNRGVLRIETANGDNQANGTVQSAPGSVRPNTWQHVAAVVQRGENRTRLYVDGHEVAVGTIGAADLDNPRTNLHIGRVPEANLFRGAIDEVRLYRRALGPAELAALVDLGRKVLAPRPAEQPALLRLQLGSRHFSGVLRQPAFLTVRLPAGSLAISAKYDGKTPLDRLVLTPLRRDDAASVPLLDAFERFDSRTPKVGVHLGLRRDCGSTLAPVQHSQALSTASEYRFDGAIQNFPSPDVQKDNDNYLAGVRDIGVRSEYTDGRDMPRLLLQSVEFEGPLYDSWPPQSHRRVMAPAAEMKNATDNERAAAIVRQFLQRAFRRPPTEAEVIEVMSVWRDSFAASQDFAGSVKDALLVALTSPQFLFLIETSQSVQPEPLDSYELASKLSYFLWNSPPDASLLAAAQRGTLQQELKPQLARMIDDAKFQRFTREFARQWLSLDK
ncbi:MAG: DUF1592 domain-containing protein, partial [Planctomycetales bacterium]|nr:DUF1592 domain-containing protein [Planctomycetales bacterium]